MKKLIKVKIKREEIQEVEVDFPIFRQHDCGGHDYSAVIYSRVEHDGTVFSIHENGRSDERSYEFEIGRTNFQSADSQDYILGLGEYACQAAEFAKVLARAKAYLERFG